jgi:hypothetical protein
MRRHMAAEANAKTSKASSRCAATDQRAPPPDGERDVYQVDVNEGQLFTQDEDPSRLRRSVQLGATGFNPALPKPSDPQAEVQTTNHAPTTRQPRENPSAIA